jgi:tRNA (adenine57-N1/adenine58-N1)-methyltransferase catalytic subunit
MNFIIDPTSRRDHVHKLMKEGDLVILYMGHTSLDHLYLKEGEVLQNKYGAFYHSDLIGRPFGSKVQSSTSSGYIYVLEPSPELWSLALDVSLLMFLS